MIELAGVLVVVAVILALVLSVGLPGQISAGLARRLLSVLSGQGPAGSLAVKPGDPEFIPMAQGA